MVPMDLDEMFMWYGDVADQGKEKIEYENGLRIHRKYNAKSIGRPRRVIPAFQENENTGIDERIKKISLEFHEYWIKQNAYYKEKERFSWHICHSYYAKSKGVKPGDPTSQQVEQDLERTSKEFFRAKVRLVCQLTARERALFMWAPIKKKTKMSTGWNIMWPWPCLKSI